MHGIWPGCAGCYRVQWQVPVKEWQETSYTQWSVAGGKQNVTRYIEKPFADEMVSILREYGFTNRCHVGRFWYFRK
jgi:hypothetical protein